MRRSYEQAGEPGRIARNSREHKVTRECVGHPQSWLASDSLPGTKFGVKPVKGVAMNRFVKVLCAAVALLVAAEGAQANGLGSLTYGGYQPWWNVFAKRNRCMSAEEERLQRFWHDYYDALRRYYGALDHIDWVAYYKNHGYQINAACGGGPGGCGGSGRIQFAPVFVSPTMQWAVPNAPLGGQPNCAPGAPMGF